VTGLFKSLFSYRERENRRPLEDWLTECLAAVIRSLNREQITELIAHLTGKEAQVIGGKLKDMPITVQTQVHTEKGRPDLVLYAGQQPFCVFENKVSHGIGHRESEGEDEDEDDRPNQLTDYAEWLAEQSLDIDELSKTLVFLSHLTLPPDGFANGDDRHDYHGVRPFPENWGRLGKYLCEITKGEGERAHSATVAREFYSFLEEEGMAREFPNSVDISALEVFLSHGSVLEHLVNKMWHELEGSFNFGKNVTSCPAHFKDNSYSRHRYLAKRYDDKSYYVQTGIWFPDNRHDWCQEGVAGAGEPKGAQVFIYFGPQHKPKLKGGHFKEIDPSKNRDILRPAGGFLVLKAFGDFPNEPDERATLILEWVKDASKRLAEILRGVDVIS